MLLVAVGCSSDSGPSGATFEELFPANGTVTGFTVSATLQTAHTTLEVQNLIDGAADPFVAAGFTAFGRQGYRNGGYTVTLDVWQMKDAATAATVYTSLLTNSLYASATWSDVAIGDGARIADTGTTWWVNVKKGSYHVQVRTTEAGAADPTARTNAINLATAVVAGR
jgi:hypothetical protein